MDSLEKEKQLKKVKQMLKEELKGLSIDTRISETKMTLMMNKEKNKSMSIEFERKEDYYILKEIEEKKFGYLSEEEKTSLCSFAFQYLEALMEIENIHLLEIKSMKKTLNKVLENKKYDFVENLLTDQIIMNIEKTEILKQEMELLNQFFTKNKNEILKIEKKFELLFTLFQLLEKEKEKDMTTKYQIQKKKYHPLKSTFLLNLYFKGNEQKWEIETLPCGSVELTMMEEKHLIQTKAEMEKIIISHLIKTEKDTRFMFLHSPSRKHFDERTEKKLGKLNNQVYGFLKKHYKPKEIEKEIVSGNYKWDIEKANILTDEYFIHQIAGYYFVVTQIGKNKNINVFNTLKEAENYFNEQISEKKIRIGKWKNRG